MMWPFTKKPAPEPEPAPKKELPPPRMDLGIDERDGFAWVSLCTRAPHYGAKILAAPHEARRLAKCMCELADAAERRNATREEPNHEPETDPEPPREER